MSRPHAITSLSSGPLVSILERMLGKVSALVSVALLADAAGASVTGAGDQTVVGAATSLNAADASLDQARLVVHGSTDLGVAKTVEAYDLTAARRICSVEIDTTPALRAGAWTTLPLFNADHEIVLRVSAIPADGSVQTLRRAELQLRTLRFQY